MKLERKTDLRTINKQELDEKTQPWFQFEKEGKIEPRSKVRVGKKKTAVQGSGIIPLSPNTILFCLYRGTHLLKYMLKKIIYIEIYTNNCAT